MADTLLGLVKKNIEVLSTRNNHKKTWYYKFLTFENIIYHLLEVLVWLMIIMHSVFYGGKNRNFLDSKIFLIYNGKKSVYEKLKSYFKIVQF